MFFIQKENLDICTPTDNLWILFRYSRDVSCGEGRISIGIGISRVPNMIW